MLESTSLLAIPRLSDSLGNTIFLLGSVGLLLLGADVFTTGIDRLGHRTGVSESATGSILASISGLFLYSRARRVDEANMQPAPSSSVASSTLCPRRRPVPHPRPRRGCGGTLIRPLPAGY